MITIQQVSRIATAVIRRRVTRADLPRVVPQGCGLVWEALRAQGLKGGHNVALYRDAGAIVEAGVELVTPFTPSGEVVLSELPGGTTARTSHFGPYQDLGAAHTAVQQWCRANGYPLGAVCWEVYGHWRTEWDEDPSKIRTDVFYQIES
jgi:effector-binding domain-containing protein